MSIFKRLTAFMGRKKVLMPIAMLGSATSAVLNILPLYYIWRIVNLLLTGQAVATEQVKQYAIYAVISSVAGILLYFVALMTSHMAAFEVEINMKKQGFERAMRMPLGFHNNNLSGKLRKVINDGAATTHTFLAHQLPDFASTILSPVVLLVMFFIFDWRMGLACLIPVVIAMFSMRLMMSPKGKELQKEYYDKLQEMSAESVEYVRGIPVVKTFGRSVHSFTRFYNSIITYKDLVYKFTVLWTVPMSIFSTVIHTAAFFLIPLAILLIDNGENMTLVLSNFILYLLIAPNFGSLFMRSAYFQNYINIAKRALDDYEQMLEYPEMEQTEQPVAFEACDLEFKNVTFQYDGSDNNAVDGVSFKLAQRQTLALVGASGSGKTTLARLAARFWDVTEGEVLIGGKNIKEYAKEDLMDHVAFVFQNNKLFKSSLRDNITFGNPEVRDEAIQQALHDSQSQEIIDQLPDGLDTIIGTKGTYLSGGEQQRIALARAFIKDAPIVILDEATAFADPENEHLIQKALKKLSQGKTTLMIAHRLTTVQDADAIAVMDAGRIVEYGTHAQLIEQNGLYAAMWQEYQESVAWQIA